MNRNEKLLWYKNEFERIHETIKDSSCLSYLDFLRIRNFKLQNSSAENEESVQKVTKEAFHLAEEDKIKEAISKLLELHGVAIPIASTILATKYPDRYAIIDVRVLKALGKDDWLKDYLSNVSTYEKYLVEIRKQAKEKNMLLRDFERSLFEKE